MSPEVEIEVLADTEADDDELVDALMRLVNEVYAVAEEGLWVDGAQRTSAEEMSGMIAGGEIATARIGGELVGCVRIQQLDDATGELPVGEFGMLAADPAHRSLGVGRELVAFAEELSLRRGLPEMQLELLVPRDWTHPAKERLHGWYTRIGYRPVRKGRIEESYPHLAPLLATTCDFVVYRKLLVA